MPSEQSYKLLDKNAKDEEGSSTLEDEDEALLDDDPLPRSRRRLWFRAIPCSYTTAVIVILAFLAAISLVLLTGSYYRKPREDVLKYIDPLIGTGLGGHVFAGATLPFAMAKPVADVAGEKQGGFAWDGSAITGFSSLHDSGTGGSPSMGNFPLFVHPACEECTLRRESRHTAYVEESVKAKPGYFGLELVSGLKAEMTASFHAALYRFSFTNGTKASEPVITLDGHDLPGSPGERLLTVDPETGRMTAEGSFEPSFGLGTYRAYTCVDIKGAKVKDVGTFNQTTYAGETATQHLSNYQDRGQGVYVRLQDFKPDDEILARVGLSWLSIERACSNAEHEIGDWSFSRLLSEAEKAWTDKLSPIEIDSTGIETKHLRNFWSGIYRAFLSPQDYTGENQLWNSTEPYYDSWYCIWDTFRGVHPLYMLMDTISQARMVRSLVDTYKHLGWLPDCRMSFCKGYTQGGSNADVVLVDAYMKKLAGVDWDDVYAALLKDAEEEPPNWDVEGRGGLESWKNLGYIPFHDNDNHRGLRTRSVSRTVEYAYNDFCIAEMAHDTGRTSDYEKYSARASNWLNVYDPDLSSMGFTGFPQPRLANGTFTFQNATLCSPINNPDGCYLNRGGHETYEGSPWLYLFYVPGDMAGLVSLLGGKEAYLSRLHKLHNSGVLYMGDEQAFLTAFLYHFAGRPGLSSKETHRYIPDMFNDTIAGIPGNDDSGAMGTFVFFSMLGVFPSAGQSVYFIIPPYFPRISIKNPQTGKTATIRVVNFDPTYNKIYIQSAKLNGKTWTKNWIGHDFFLKGGTLELVVGETESEWGTRDEDLPPSLSTTGVYSGD